MFFFSFSQLTFACVVAGCSLREARAAFNAERERQFQREGEISFVVVIVVLALGFVLFVFGARSRFVRRLSPLFSWIGFSFSFSLFAERMAREAAAAATTGEISFVIVSFVRAWALCWFLCAFALCDSSLAPFLMDLVFFFFFFVRRRSSSSRRRRSSSSSAARRSSGRR